MRVRVRNRGATVRIGGHFFGAGSTTDVNTFEETITELKANRRLEVTVVDLDPAEELVCECGYVAKTPGGLAAHRRAPSHSEPPSGFATVEGTASPDDDRTAALSDQFEGSDSAASDEVEESEPEVD